MALFEYQARDREGKLKLGTLEAMNSQVAVQKLNEVGLIPVAVRSAAQASSDHPGKSQERLFGRKVKAGDMFQLTRQLYSLTQAGVPILTALTSLARSTHDVLIKRALADAIRALESGRDLASSLALHPEVFSPFYVSIVRVGEQSGRLDNVLWHLSTYIEREKKTKDQIKSAIRYPTIVIASVLIAIGFLNVKVVPAFKGIFDYFGSELPWPTQILIALSNFFVDYWTIMVIVIFTALIAFQSYIRTMKGRYLWDRAKFRLPVIGQLIYQATMSRFARLFAISMRANLPLFLALGAVAKAQGNLYAETKISQVYDRIERGATLTEAARDSELFDELVLQMLNVGEQTGVMEDLLDVIADYFENEVDYSIKRLNEVIPAIITVLLGGMVLILALGIFLPMWDLAGVALNRQ